MTGKELYAYALDTASGVVAQVHPEHWQLPTPDTEWTVRDLLSHTLYELAWAADIVAGKTIAEVGDRYNGDLFGADPVASWRRYAGITRQAVETCDERATAHLSYGDTSVEEYLWEAGNDQLVHAWDLGQAIEVEITFDPAIAAALYERAYARRGELTGSGLFAPPVVVPDSADVQTKLLALLGRSNDWRTNA